MMFLFNKKREFPPFYKRYLDRIQDGFNDEIISLDMETTGVDIKKSDIISFGSVVLVDKKIKVNEELHLHFLSHQYDKENIKVHEILPGMAMDTIEDFIPKILDEIGNRTILGHYVEFDIALLNHQLKKMKLPKIKNPTRDTLKMALQYDGIRDLSRVRKEDYTLYALCERFNIPIIKMHNAIEDAYLTALLYLHLMKDK